MNILTSCILFGKKTPEDPRITWEFLSPHGEGRGFDAAFAKLLWLDVCSVTLLSHFVALSTIDLSHCIVTGTLSLGTDGSDIVMHGPGIVARHAEIINSDGEVMLVPIDGSVLHNGKLLQSPVILCHGDR